VLKIRLRRVGAKKQPSYRIVVAESTSPRDGRFVEIVGHYNPRTEPETVTVNNARASYWLSHGAQPTPAVERLLKKYGAYDYKPDEPASVSVAPAASVAAPVTETVAQAAPTVAEAVTAPTAAVAEAVSEPVETIVESATDDEDKAAETTSVTTEG